MPFKPGQSGNPMERRSFLSLLVTAPLIQISKEAATYGDYCNYADFSAFKLLEMPEIPAEMREILSVR